MISALLRRWNSLQIAQLRNRCLPLRLAPHMMPDGSVLDVGSGSGEIAERLPQMGCVSSIRGVDVLAQPDPRIPTVTFDGRRLPYDDGAFDLVAVIDVLHPTPHPARLLAEAVRVSRDRVVIKGHYWVSTFDRWVLALSDYLGNKAHGVSLPYAFLGMEQWASLFDDLALTVVAAEQFRYAPHDLTKQVIFVVRRAPSGRLNRG